MFDSLFPKEWTTLQRLMWLKTNALARAVYEIVTGNPVTFSAKAAPLRQLKVAFSPVQSLNGYDSPWPAGGGANLFNPSAWIQLGTNSSYYSVSGETITVTANDNAGISARLFDVEAGATYSAFHDGDFGSMRVYASDSTTIMSGNSASFIAPEDGKIAVKFLASSYPVSGRCIIVKSSTIPTAWTPYSNECPIVGWTGVNVWQAGENLWDEELEQGGIDDSTGEPAIAPTQRRSKNYIPVSPETSYYACAPNAGTGGFWAYCYDENKSFIGRVQKSGGYDLRNAQFTTLANCHYIKFKTQSSTDDYTDIAINYPATDTEYHAYDPASQVIHVAFPAVGVNQWDEEYEEGIYNTSGEKESRSGYNRTKNRIPVIPSAAYYVQQAIAEHGVFCTYDENGVFNHRLTSSDVLNGVLTIPADAYYLVFACSQSYWTSDTKVFINYPATDTSYHAFDGTRYSGWVDLITGDGGVNKLKHTFSAGDVWTYYDNGANSFFYLFPISAGTAKSTQTVITENGVEVGLNGNNGQVRVYLSNNPFLSADTDIASFMATYGFVYELAEPIPFHVDPQEVQSLLGENVLFSDANGDLTVEYRSN